MTLIYDKELSFFYIGIQGLSLKLYSFSKNNNQFSILYITFVIGTFNSIIIHLYISVSSIIYIKYAVTLDSI